MEGGGKKQNKQASLNKGNHHQYFCVCISHLVHFSPVITNKIVLRRRKLVKLETSWKKEALECNLFYFWLKWRIVKPNRNDCKNFKYTRIVFFRSRLPWRGCLDGLGILFLRLSPWKAIIIVRLNLRDAFVKLSVRHCEEKVVIMTQDTARA